MSKKKNDEWISVVGAVERFKVISTTLYYLKVNGAVRAVQMPDSHPERKTNVKFQWLYAVSDLERWHAEHLLRKSRARLRAQHRAELAEHEQRARHAP